MALQLINVGASADDKTGDPGRVGGIKINDNFTELYGLINKDSGETGIFSGSVECLRITEDVAGSDTVTWSSAQAGATILSNQLKIEPPGLAGEVWLGDSVGFMKIDPFAGSFQAPGTVLTFGNSVFNPVMEFNVNVLRPGTTDAIHLGDGTKTWASVRAVDAIFEGDCQLGDATSDLIGFYGVTGVNQAAAMTAADTNTPNSGDATTDNIIANLQTRVNELEAMLDSTTGIGVVA